MHAARLAIKARRIIDGTGRPPIERGVVLVEGERITAVGREADLPIPQGAEVIDCGGQTLLPGFVDAHSHASIVPGLGDQIGQLRQPPVPQLLRAIQNLRLDLRSGVTTMRVVGEEHFIDVDLRGAIAAGTLPGPRLLVATRPITARNGHGAALTYSDGEDEIRKRIRENVARGADLIKLFMTGGTSSKGTSTRWYAYTPHEVQVAVEEAHRNNKPIAVHAHGGPGVKICIDAGVDTIEHGKLCDPDDFVAMRKRGTWLVTNNAVSGHPDGIEKGDAHEPSIMAKLKEARARSQETFRSVLESGVRWALGTDSMHGLMWWEIAQVVEWGADRHDAIQAATRRAAEAIGLANEVGTLEPGKLADVISVDANPLEDISSLRRVGLILQGGRRRDTLSAE
ncbi:MAG TPA: amidohydrolase family protein [bacterium]|nr:amidohydrolase family protein [bacterium]